MCTQLELEALSWGMSSRDLVHSLRSMVASSAAPTAPQLHKPTLDELFDQLNSDISTGARYIVRYYWCGPLIALQNVGK